MTPLPSPRCDCRSSTVCGSSVGKPSPARCGGAVIRPTGRTGTDVPGVRTVRGTGPAQMTCPRLAAKRPRHAVVGTSSSQLAPRDVLVAAQAPLSGIAWGRISTVSVYANWLRPTAGRALATARLPTGRRRHVRSQRRGRIAHRARVPPGAGDEGAVAAARRPSRVRQAGVVRPRRVRGPSPLGAQPGRPRRPHPRPAHRHIQPVDVRDVAPVALGQAATEHPRQALDIAHPTGTTVP